jgi:hypothetical protein
VIITTGRILRTLVNKINLHIDSARSIEASRLAPIKAESIFLRCTPVCFGTSHGLSRDSSSTTSPRAGSSSTTSPTPRVRVSRHVARLVAPLVINFDYTARPGATARRAARCRLLRLRCASGASARHAARRRLLRLRRVSGCFGTSCGSSRGSSSTTLPTPRVRVPRHVARLVMRLVVDYFASHGLVVDYFAYAACPGASARRAARHAARR